MHKDQQLRIAADLCDGLKDYILSKIDSIPATWDGIEIRQWISDAANEQIDRGDMDTRRRHDYQNERLIKNL